MDARDLVPWLLFGALVLYAVAQVGLNLRPKRTAGGALSPAVDDWRVVYAEAGQVMRHYATLRFAQLTVLIAVTTALVAAISAAQSMLTADQRWVLRVVALLATFAFLVMQERAVDLWHAAKRTAVAIESARGLRLVSSWSERRVFSATNATRLVHIGLAGLWLVMR